MWKHHLAQRDPDVDWTDMRDIITLMEHPKPDSLDNTILTTKIGNNGDTFLHEIDMSSATSQHKQSYLFCFDREFQPPIKFANDDCGRAWTTQIQYEKSNKVTVYHISKSRIPTSK